MGKKTPRLVVAVLIVAALVSLALQNWVPNLTLVFLGIPTVTLPLGLWLSGAIALGALTAIAIIPLTSPPLSSVSRPHRRRWTVRPETPQPDSGKPSSARSWNVRSPQEMFRRNPPPQDTPPPCAPASNNASSRPQSTAPPPSSAVAAEDWQAWGKRPSPSQWDDWSQASGNDPMNENLPRRQRQDRQTAEAAIHDLDKGWDNSAQDTVYVAPGGSDVEDALDDITDGWEDWESDDNPLADTAYAQRYDGVKRKTRRDSIYAPPDDKGDDYEDWDTPGDPTKANNSDNGDSRVYDADYRVIIPPYRPLDDEENESDRAT